MNRWGKNVSLWLDTTPPTDFRSLEGSPAVDVAIVGGGIAGLEAAYFLAKDGMSVAVIDAQRIVRDVTGYTTGKLTSQHGLIYKYLTDNFGAQKAQIYADANQAAIERIAGIIDRNSIHCDFKRTSAYVFTEDAAKLAELKAEVEPARRLGLEASYVEDTPLGYARGAVRFENQAQWHPRKFLLHLAGEILISGGYIFENTMALQMEDGKVPLLKTDKGDLKAANVVIATNMPFHQPQLFAPILKGTRSYVLGVRLSGEVPEGVYYGIDPATPSMRNQPVQDGKIFMVGGWDKDLKIYETARQYEMVERYARDRFDIASIDYNWFTQDQKTPDRVSLIGRMPGSKNVFIAAGFNGWGMTNSCVSAMILSDLIAGRYNPWASLYDPARLIKG